MSQPTAETSSDADAATPALGDDLPAAVTWLEAALADVIREQESEPTDRRIRDVFELARDRRMAADARDSRLSELLATDDHALLRAIIRAHAIRLDLLNAAEDHQRALVLRHRSKHHPQQPRGGSVADAVRQLADAGADTLQRMRDALSVELVMTAHPTDAKRRAVRTALRSVRQLLERYVRADLLPSERDETDRQLHATLTTLWQTDLVRPQPPTVRQEIGRGLNIARRLWSVVPRIYRDLDEAYDARPADADAPPPLRFASWIGGDRDGHPFVTVTETRYALRAARRLAVQLHRKQADALFHEINLSDRRQEVDDCLRSRLSDAVAHWPQLKARVEAEAEHEVYRRFMRVVQWRLEQTQRDHAGRYGSADALLDDLLCIDHSLRGHRAARIADQRLRDWINQVRAFGLHMLRLDIRQHSRVYVDVIHQLLDAAGHGSYRDADETRRIDLLQQTFGKPIDARLGALSDTARETVELFRLINRTLDEQPDALGGHVVSMTHQPSDILAVLWLLALTRDSAPTRHAHVLPVIPLFETVDDLQRARETLGDLFTHPLYLDHLAHLHKQQTVMIGYSDSTKDGGYVAACWSLHEAQARMANVADQHGVTLTFFHGRGGSLGRGGGPAARSIASLPPHTVNGRIRITEQGEVLVDRYDDRRIAYRHLEQVVSATLLTADDADESIDDTWQNMMTQLASRARSAYLDLIHLPKFIEYFRSATPIGVVEQLQIGSRPSRRRGQQTLEDLRAIPWVFAWTQSRQMIPAWFGLGAAAADWLDDADRLAQLRDMFRQWGFFRGMIENAALALSKFDADIASRYADIAGDDARDIWQRIAAEADRSTDALRRIMDVDHLLDDVPWLRDAIDARNPIVDPLNLLQISLMTGLDSNENDPDRLDLLRLTVYGIAAGLRTTG